jgi:abequosyltransferase
MPDPVLSLCIPTCWRQAWLAKCLEAALPQVEALTPGQVEVVVSDNASPDRTWDYLQETAARHPCLRIRRNPANNYTANFNSVVLEAHGRFVWLMGDDDAPLPGAVARILAEVQERPRDLYVLHALEADLEDRPLERRSWFRDLPRQDWDLRQPAALKEYLDHTAYMAGVFGFISVLVFRREAWLEGLEESLPFVPLGWPHVALGLSLARRCGQVRVLPDTLLLNRVGNDTGAEEDLFRRIMHDLRGWVRLADRFFRDEPALRRAFIGVLRRNTSEGTVTALRATAPEPAAWEEAKGLLLAAYHAPQGVAQADLAYAALQQGRRPPSPALDAGTLCFADLGFVARGARRAAVLVQDPREPGAAQLVALLQARSRALVRVYGGPGAAALEGPGLQGRAFDLERFVGDIPFRAPLLADFREFAPDLVVNADPGRHPALDLLAASFAAVAALAGPASGKALKPQVQAWLDGAYHWILPAAGADAMAAALGLGPEPRPDPEAGITPAAPAAIASQAFLVELDWNGGYWVEVLLSYLEAFKPGEPVLLIFFLGRDRGGLTVAEATRRIVEQAKRTGRQAFPDVIVLDDLVELGKVLVEYPVHVRLRPGRGDVEGLVGPFGVRLAATILGRIQAGS